ncbi:MAG: DUF6851 domain-containing protein [Planctomycetota bacterium]
MISNHHHLFATLVRTFATGLLAVYLCASTRANDVIVDWNATLTEVLRDNTSLQNPGMASRSMAMMNLAIYDAVAMTSPTGTMFYNYGMGHSSPGIVASKQAAISQAAYDVLSSIYPDQQTALDNALTSSLSTVANGQTKQDGIALGSSIAQSIIGRRQNDGYNTNSQYMPTNLPGRWQPDPTVTPTQEAWGPAWGDVVPFAVDSGTQFMPAPMPDLTSQAYTDAFNEVKALGAVNSATRTPEQTEIGLFWAYDRVGLGTPMRLYNDVLRTVATDRNNTLEENAALFAKASVAVADAGITAWNSKFEYDFWRPVTGIREADTDGNLDTIADPNWTPLGAPGDPNVSDDDFTPPFPTYLSGHATFGGALFGTLAEFYGDNYSFSLASEELALLGYADDTREFTSFSQAMAENGRSRVYLGIHWNFDDTVAQATGQEIAQYIASAPFIASAIPEPSSITLGLTVIATIGCCRPIR